MTLLIDDARHGTENAYSNLGCRCDSCRVAHREHARRSSSHQAANLTYKAAAAYVKANHPVVWKRLLADAYKQLGAQQRRAGRPSDVKDTP